ncbi:50S ribosomal protein L31 [Candidatus Gottesmanbacteria bacterium]|nr:50S ribosomal protein L31 [Candidatus Gottesmanbacteria bacterium]
MKPNIHPKWFTEALVTCACGKTFTVGSTRENIHVEICYNCHPFFTGEMKYVDTLGRVERYQEKQKVAKTKAAQVQAKKKKKEEEKIKEERSPKSLREMLMGRE